MVKENLPFIDDNVPEPTASNLSETCEMDTEFGNRTRGQIAAYAGLALFFKYRKHFFSMLILGRFARFIRWDRRGAIVTHRFNYMKRPKLIFEFYRAIGAMANSRSSREASTLRQLHASCQKPVVEAFGRYSSAYGGGDFSRRTTSPSFDNTHGFRAVAKDPTKDPPEAFYVLPSNYHRGYVIPFSRATKHSLAYLARQDMQKPKAFFSWQEVSSRTVREAEIHRKLEKEKVQHVASMRLGGDIDLMVTESQKCLPKKYREIVYHRLVLETVARSLSTFTGWCKVLLSCIADAVEGAQQAYKVGILHGDLSAGNIMIVKNKKTEEWNGVLIDWDMSVLWQNKKVEARSGRTGTWAFISAKILLSPGPCPRTLCDDIESAFWVLLHQAMLYTNHNLGPNKLYKHIQATFSYVAYDANGSPLGGKQKVQALHSCADFASSSDIAIFAVAGLNDLLDTLGAMLRHRYSGKERRLAVDLDESDEKCFPNLLRETAMAMGPRGVTPTALVSPTNYSNPAKEQDDWERASTKPGTDFCPMGLSARPAA